MTNMQKIRGELFLILATVIWGSAFVFQKMGMDYLGPLTFTAFRFGIGAMCMIPIMLVSDKLAKRKVLKCGSSEKSEITGMGNRALIIGGISVGVANFAGSALQQLGIVYTTAGKAGFLTAMDMVMVPIVLLFLKEKVHLITWLGIAIATVGAYFMCMSGDFSIQRGDMFCLAGALAYAIQIILIDRFVKGVDPLKLAFYEFAVTAVLSLVAAVAFEEIELASLVACRIPLLYTAVFEVCIAFSLQMVGQQYVPSAVAALTLSLESVFAVLSGMVLLGETMSGRETAGCIIMFAAFIIAQIPELRGNGEGIK